MDTLKGEAVGVAGSVTLDKSVTPEFAQVVAELIETVTFIGALTLTSAVWRSGGCQQFDNLIDGLVGAVVGGFELAVWAMFCVGLVVEAAVGEWSAQTFVEQ